MKKIITTAITLTFFFYSHIATAQIYDVTVRIDASKDFTGANWGRDIAREYASGALRIKAIMAGNDTPDSVHLTDKNIILFFGNARAQMAHEQYAARGLTRNQQLPPLFEPALSQEQQKQAREFQEKRNKANAISEYLRPWFTPVESTPVYNNKENKTGQ